MELNEMVLREYPSGMWISGAILILLTLAMLIILIRGSMGISLLQIDQG